MENDRGRHLTFFLWLPQEWAPIYTHSHYTHTQINMNKWVNKHSLSISGYLKIIPGRLVLGYETIVSDFEFILFYYKEESNTNQWPEALFSLQTAVVEGGSSWLIPEDTFSAICHSRHGKKGDLCRPRGGAGWSLGWFPVYSLKTKHGHGSWAQK